MAGEGGSPQTGERGRYPTPLMREGGRGPLTRGPGDQKSLPLTREGL